ncbi:nitrite reductase large subunit NirB [Sediminibacillus massiliensis]|uniref:nitrite reductase large subunit NirB n=1 Tax=Sediminibacillus massiliensis TaxID=1926277 RepID=UPI0009888FC5|nr:nitrite reductase large subunit NirB [Sediminibacillus massiliensis]
MKKKLVLIGNGMAGVRCIENILKENACVYDITIFGSEPHVNYNRIMLSSVLQGGTGPEEIIINDKIWYLENNLTLFSGETIIDIDSKAKMVISDAGRKVRYDKLIIATGSTPFILPVNGADKNGVISFRTIEDCEKMMKAAEKHRKAVVIGGGLLGLEAARGLLNLGMEVDVVHISDALMERQLDKAASSMLQKELEARGMNFLMGKETEKIWGNERVEGIRFKDGTVVQADLIVMAVGVKPNIELAKRSGIATNRGIVVDDVLSTSTHDVYAVGECAEHNGVVYGLVKPLYEQGEILARHLTGKATNGYQGSVMSTQLKISDVDVFSAGQLSQDEEVKSIQIYNEVEGIYKKILFRGNKVVGAVLFGDTQVGPAIFDSIVKRKVFSDKDKVSLLETPDPSASYAATMPSTGQICTCNGVTKGEIIQAVQRDSLSTVHEVRNCTKASSSCGSCKPLVSELLSYIQSEYFDEQVVDNSLCTCTPLTEDDVVEQIQSKNLSSLQEVFMELEWKVQKGCNICRSAIEYHLNVIYPFFEKDDDSSFADEKMTVAILHDDTYAIIPKIYAGLIKAEQLRNLTEISKKYPEVKMVIAGDQRIHLTGIRKEQLSSIRNELDIPLQSANSNMAVEVRTDGGDHSCRCNKHPSFNLAELIEKKTEFLKTPHRVKIGISSCNHNGAGFTSKDVGVIKRGGKWEIYVGGNSGSNVRQGELLCVGINNKEAIDIITAFIQYYRNSANYLERTWQWIDRVGLMHIREVLFEEDLRNQLLDSLEAVVREKGKYLVNSR